MKEEEFKIDLGIYCLVWKFKNFEVGFFEYYFSI